MGGSLQCIQKHFDDIWGKRPIHYWGKKPMEGLLPQLPFPSTSCTGVFYRLMFVVFSSMPRTYKRKTERACYSQDDLQRALEAVHNGMLVRHASLQHGVSEKNIRRHRDGRVANPGILRLGRYRPDLDVVHENELVQHIKKIEKALFGLTPTDVRRLAYDYATKLGIDHRFNTEAKMAGPDWLSGFLRMHSELSIRKPEATSISRAVGFNQGQVGIFFKVYKEMLESQKYASTRVWNMDETGITNVQKPTKIIASKGAREVGKMTSGEKGKTVTAVCAMNASGTYLPPMLIFPRKKDGWYPDE